MYSYLFGEEKKMPSLSSTDIQEIKEKTIFDIFDENKDKQLKSIDILGSWILTRDECIRTHNRGKSIYTSFISGSKTTITYWMTNGVKIILRYENNTICFSINDMKIKNMNFLWV